MNTGFERNTSLALINYLYLSKLMFTDKMTENTKGQQIIISWIKYDNHIAKILKGKHITECSL